MSRSTERWLVISDVHLPYDDRKAVATALDCARSERVSGVVINGDLLDCEAISRFDKTTRMTSLSDEIEHARNWLAALRARLPRARIIYRIGNHEERLEHYLMRYAREIAYLGVVTIDRLLDLDAHRIEWISERTTRLRLGKLSILHGHEIGSAASVNIAHSVLRRVMCNVIVGHWHRRQSETLKTYAGDYIGCWVTGCLRNLHPDYRPVNQWQHGFAIVDVLRSGNFVVRNHVIIRGDVL